MSACNSRNGYIFIAVEMHHQTVTCLPIWQYLRSKIHLYWNPNNCHWLIHLCHKHLLSASCVLSQAQSWGRQGAVVRRSGHAPVFRALPSRGLLALQKEKKKKKGLIQLIQMNHTHQISIYHLGDVMELSKWELDQNEGVLLPHGASVHPKSGLEMAPMQDEEGRVGIRLQRGWVAFSFIFLTPCQVDHLQPSKGSVSGVATSTEV